MYGYVPKELNVCGGHDMQQITKSVVQYVCQKNHNYSKVNLLGCSRVIINSYKRESQNYANNYGYIHKEDMGVCAKAQI